MFPDYVRMIAAENIVIAYRSRQASNNWAEWAKSYPVRAERIAEAEKLYAISRSSQPN